MYIKTMKLLTARFDASSMQDPLGDQTLAEGTIPA